MTTELTIFADFQNFLMMLLAYVQLTNYLYPDGLALNSVNCVVTSN